MAHNKHTSRETMNTYDNEASCNNAPVRSMRSIGSGTFSIEQRITLNEFGRCWSISNTDTHTKGRRNPPTTVAYSAASNATAVNDAQENVKVAQLVYEDDNISLSVASDAPEDVQQSLKDMSLYSSKSNAALHIVSSGTSTNKAKELLPQLTTSSTSTQSSSVSSQDGGGDSSSPVSSLCGSNHRTDRRTIPRSHQQRLEDEEECCSSNDSYCSSSDELKNDDIVDHPEQLEAAAAAVGSTTTTCLRSPPDIYGQQHPIETETLVASKLHEFNQRIQHAITTFHSSATTMNQQHQTLNEPKFMIAERVCPDVTTASFKLMFLRCECYHVENSIKRYTKYWEKRVELFGPIRAYQPITAQSFYDHNDHAPLETGAMQIIYRSDPTERNLLWFDPSKLDPTKYTRESGCRAFWYVFHCYLEDELVQQQGMICLAFFQHFSLKHRDPTFTRMCIQSVQGCIPIRVSAFHGCHPPKYVRCILAVFLILIGDRLRKRVLVHAGSYQHVIEILETKYNISKQCIPAVMGGENQLNIRNCIQQRKAKGV